MALMKYKRYSRTNKMKNYDKTDYTITLPWTSEGFPGLNANYLETNRKKSVFLSDRYGFYHM